MHIFNKKKKKFVSNKYIIIIIETHNTLIHLSKGTLVYQVQMIPSSSGDRVGRRPIQRAVLPLQREIASRWKRWRVASAGGMSSH